MRYQNKGKRRSASVTELLPVPKRLPYLEELPVHELRPFVTEHKPKGMRRNRSHFSRAGLPKPAKLLLGRQPVEPAAPKASRKLQRKAKVAELSKQLELMPLNTRDRLRSVNEVFQQVINSSSQYKSVLSKINSVYCEIYSRRKYRRT